MHIYVDADACPVIVIVERIAKSHNIAVTLLCDTNHYLTSDYSEVVYVGAGAAVTEVLGKWTDGGSLGQGFAMLSIVVAVALVLQIYFLRPKTDNMVD